jgi:parallel beta-helix repeat protein
MLVRARQLFVGMLVIVLCIMTLFCVSLRSVRGFRWTVPDDYDTIQKAINVASPGDEIYVRNGTYKENLLINKSLTLTGESNYSTIIDGGGVDTCVKVKGAYAPPVTVNVAIKGFFITNSGNGSSDAGLTLDGVLDCQIENNQISGNGGNGVFLNQSAYNSVSGNFIDLNNRTGIVLEGSGGNFILLNSLDRNAFGIVLLGNSSQNQIISNNVTESQSGISVQNGFRNRLSENFVENSVYTGVGLYDSTQTDFSNNTMKNNTDGVLLDSCKNTTIQGSTIEKSADTGVALHNSTETDVYNNTDIDSIVALLLDACENNTFRGNKMWNNSYGAVVENSQGNIFDGNDLTNESHSALWIYYSHNNTFYHNSIGSHELEVFLNNSINAWDGGTQWSDGGNYWINYTGADLNHDGIGDSAKILDANNVDHFPLMGSFLSFNFSQGTIEVITNSTLQDLSYFGSNTTVELHVSNVTSNQTSAFARFAIPHSFMNVSRISVVIDDGLIPLLYSNYSLYDNGTHRWIYVQFPLSTHKIDIIPEYSPWIALPFLIIATGLAMILCKHRRQMSPRN